MNPYVTGAVIKTLREKERLTQTELAKKLNVSDKTISKWETGKGYPDISLLDPIAKAFRVSVVELLSGNTVQNTNVSANMLKSNFYVCPLCGNVVHSMGESVVICHGITLPPLDAEDIDDLHPVSIEEVENEYFVSVAHDMTRTHYISFLAAVSYNRVQIVKLYPEGNAEARFKMNNVKTIYFYCNKDELFIKNVG